MKIFLIVLLILLLLVPLILGFYLVISNGFYKKYFTKKSKFLKKLNEKNKLENGKENQKQEGKASIFSDFKEIKINRDDADLFGYYKDNGFSKIVILLHSFGGSHENLSLISSFFLQENFDILALDMRGHGKSGGEISFGQEEEKDLLLWIEKILTFKENYKVAIFGVGLGGTSGLLSLPKLPQNVRLVISESGFDNAKKELSFLLSETKVKPDKKLFYKFLKQTKNLDLKNLDAVESLKKAKLPVMLIHDEEDEVVPIEMAYELQKALPPFNKNLFIAKGAGHGKGIVTQPFQFKMNLSKALKNCGL